MHAHHARAIAAFALSEVLEEDVVKNESEDKLEGLAALFLENERNPAVRIRGYVEEVAYKERHAISITQVAAIRARENNSGRYQCFFNRFNLGSLMRVKKLSNLTNRKRFFANRTRNNSINPTTLKRFIPIEHDLKCRTVPVTVDKYLSPSIELANFTCFDRNLARSRLAATS